MSALEDRLTAELRAESELIKPESLAGLILPELGLAGMDRSGLGRSGLGRSGAGRRAGRWWPPWLAPLAAAAAVLAVVAGALAAARVFSGPSAQQPAAPAPPVCRPTTRSRSAATWSATPPAGPSTPAACSAGPSRSARPPPGSW